MRKGGVEPPRPKALDPKSRASTNFATFAAIPCLCDLLVEGLVREKEMGRTMGLEPTTTGSTIQGSAN